MNTRNKVALIAEVLNGVYPYCFNNSEDAVYYDGDNYKEGNDASLTECDNGSWDVSITGQSSNHTLLSDAIIELIELTEFQSYGDTE